MPILYSFAGLPGTGKSTLARSLAGDCRAVYLRIDTIEQAVRDARLLRGPEGYLIAYAVAVDNLGIGRDVVADSVNPVGITRNAWRDVAERCKSGSSRLRPSAPTLRSTEVELKRVPPKLRSPSAEFVIRQSGGVTPVSSRPNGPSGGAERNA